MANESEKDMTYTGSREGWEDCLRLPHAVVPLDLVFWYKVEYAAAKGRVAFCDGPEGMSVYRCGKVQEFQLKDLL